MTCVFFDSMQNRSDVLKSKIEVVDVADLWKMISTLDLARAYQAAEPRPSILLECLYAGSKPAGMYFDVWDREQQAFANFLLEIADENVPIETFAGREDLPKIYALMSRYSGGRRLISTTRGLLGIAPSGVMDGDVCAIIFGCAFLLILRRVTGRADNEVAHYTIIGIAWIAGLPTIYRGRMVVRLTGSKDSKDWGLKEHDIHIVWSGRCSWAEI